MSRSSRRFAALVAGAAILLSACGTRDVHGKDAVNVLKDAGASDKVSKCVGNTLEDQLSQKELNPVGAADKLSELDNDLQQTVEGVLDQCVQSGGESAGTESTSTTEGSGDTTTTSQPG